LTNGYGDVPADAAKYRVFKRDGDQPEGGYTMLITARIAVVAEHFGFTAQRVCDATKQAMAAG